MIMHLHKIIFMVKEVDKYSAEILKIAGFALMTLFGRVALQPTVVFNELGLTGFIFYIIFSLFLFFIGVLMLVKGYDILDKEWRSYGNELD